MSKKMYSDGYTIGKNPSNIGGGYVVTDKYGTVLEEKETKPLFGTMTTNNEVELLGILAATELADKEDQICSDSFCAIAWIKRGRCKARPDLSFIAKRAKDNIKYKGLTLIQVPREINQAGIYIEKKGYDSFLKKTKKKKNKKKKQNKKKLIYVCSPLRGNIEENIENAKLYSRQIALDGDIPITPHIYFTQFLDDTIEEERKLGMEIGLELLDMCDELRIFGDKITEGMQKEIDYFNKKVCQK